MFNPIAPLTGEDSEWNDITEMCGGHTQYQNNRCSAVFKKEDGTFSYNDAYVADVMENGKVKSSWNTSHFNIEDIGYCRIICRIKSFPFTPETIRLRVTETEVAPDDWELNLIDKNQIDDLKKIYNVTIEVVRSLDGNILG
jgi:hypothetical protein